MKRSPYSVLYYKTILGFTPCNAKVFTGDKYEPTLVYYKLTDKGFIEIRGKTKEAE